MMASTTMKRNDRRPLRRLFSRRPRARAASVPDAIRMPAPAARCPACELRDYLSG
jgi:hypothetical protein